MNDKLERAQNTFIERVGRIGNILGINSFNAKLYAFLYLHKEPKSLDEITEALGVSKGNVSLNIRELEKWGAVKNVWVKGSRKDFYQVNPDIKTIFLSNIKSAIQKRINELSSLLQEFQEILQSSEGNLTKEEACIMATYKERLKQIEELKNLASNALSLADKFF